MTEIVRLVLAGGRQAISGQPELRLSQALERALEAAVPARYPGRGDGDPGFLLRAGTPVPVELAPEARGFLDAPSLQPADHQTIGKFLAKIGKACANPPDPDVFEARIEAVLWLCEDLPRLVFTPDAQREIVRRCQFFPSGREVRDAVIACAKPKLDCIEMLKSVVRRAEERPRSGSQTLGAVVRNIGEARDRG